MTPVSQDWCIAAKNEWIRLHYIAFYIGRYLMRIVIHLLTRAAPVFNTPLSFSRPGTVNRVPSGTWRSNTGTWHDQHMASAHGARQTLEVTRCGVKLLLSAFSTHV